MVLWAVPIQRLGAFQTLREAGASVHLRTAVIKATQVDSPFVVKLYASKIAPVVDVWAFFCDAVEVIGIDNTEVPFVVANCVVVKQRTC